MTTGAASIGDGTKQGADPEVKIGKLMIINGEFFFGNSK